VIRIVSLRKAVLAGMAGAVAWEVVLRLLGLAGLPLVDIVHGLGQLAFPGGATLLWWLAGMALHMLVGVIWAIFYAYFAWSMLPLRPLVQGLVFALVPTVLAIGVVYPQIAVMQAPEHVLHVSPWALAAQVSWPERAGILLGHLAYGALLGALYTHPVGAPTGKAQRVGSTRRKRSRAAPAKVADRGESAFIFATGIECSYPTLEAGRWRCDQMAASGHYRRYAEDFDLCVELGLSHLRYGPPLHLICRGPGAYDWSFIDEAMEAMRARGVTPIIDLCHFGLPDWLENFQNPEVPEALAAYAGVFAARYPWVRLYTPVNEMYVCARLSALEGLWNEQRRDERSFLTAVRHLARANLGMMQAIAAARPDAVFVHSESGEFYQPCCPDPEIVAIADFENGRRFLPFDLLRARAVSDGMRAHLREHGMPDEEYAWFMAQTPPRRTVLGVDYYAWNEKLIDTEGQPRALGELFGWYVIASQYWERYRLPMMHTETNHLDAREAPRWLWRQWHNVELIRRAGVPIVGFTWYSLTDQVDWDIALAEPLGNVNPVGLFDLNRDPRSVGQAYRHLIHTFRDEPAVRGCAALREVLA
jgi:beta-glucosidase/6-phospho-beta-glucosidase/beta-galactosidase